MHDVRAVLETMALFIMCFGLFVDLKFRGFLAVILCKCALSKQLLTLQVIFNWFAFIRY